MTDTFVSYLYFIVSRSSLNFDIYFILNSGHDSVDRAAGLGGIKMVEQDEVA
jgi:hypothetical protein